MSLFLGNPTSGDPEKFVPSLDYVAGFFDGEGLARIWHFNSMNRFSPDITFYNNDRDTLEAIRGILPGHGRLFRKGARKGTQSDCYELKYRRWEDCLAVAKILVGRTRIKRAELAKLIEFITVNEKKSKGLYPSRRGARS
jgi:hypothetical protein